VLSGQARQRAHHHLAGVGERALDETLVEVVTQAQCEYRSALRQRLW
jgi:hypothetical protein